MELFSILVATAVAILFFLVFRPNLFKSLERKESQKERPVREGAADFRSTAANSPRSLPLSNTSPSRPFTMLSMKQPEWNLLKPKLNLFCNEMSSVSVLSYSSEARAPLRDPSSISCKIIESPDNFDLHKHGSVRMDLKRGANEATLHFSSSVPGLYAIEIQPSSDSRFICHVTVNPFAPSRSLSIVRLIRSTAPALHWTDVAAIWLKDDNGNVLRPANSVVQGQLKAKVSSDLDRTASRVDWLFRQPSRTEILGSETSSPSFILVARPCLEVSALSSQGLTYTVELGGILLTSAPLKLRVPHSDFTSCISSPSDLSLSHRVGVPQVLHIPLTAIPDPSWTLSAFAVEQAESSRLKCYRKDARFEIDFRGRYAGQTKIFVQLCPPSEDQLVQLSPQEDFDPDNWFLTEADLSSQYWNTQSLKLQKETVLAMGIIPEWQLPGSPLLLSFDPGNVSPTLSRAFGSGLTSDGIVQSRRKFFLSLKDNYGNTILGPLHKDKLPLEIYIYDANDREVKHRLFAESGKVCVEFEAKTSGRYTVNVSSDERPFPGSPFTFTLFPLPQFEASNSSIVLQPGPRDAQPDFKSPPTSPAKSPIISAVAGADLKLEIDFCDKYGNSVVALQEVRVECVKADLGDPVSSGTAQSSPKPPIVVFDHQHQKHFLIVNQPIAGRYEVCLRDPASGEIVKNSPANVSIVASSLDAAKSYMEIDQSSLSDGDLRVGILQKLRIFFKDRFGNPVSVPRKAVELVIRSGNSDLKYQVSIQGPSLREYRDDYFELSTIVNDVWTVCVTPLTVGEFEVFARVVTPEGSTRTVVIRDSAGKSERYSRIKVVPGVTSALFSSVASNGFETARAGVAHYIDFAARDSNGLPKRVGGDPFRVTLAPVERIPGELPRYSCGIEDLTNGSYRLMLSAQRAGKYQAHIFLLDQEILGSPVTFNVSAGPPANVFLVNPDSLPGSILAGEIAKLPIICKDIFGNPVKASNDVISINFDAGNQKVSSADVIANIESSRLPDGSLSSVVAFGCTRSMAAHVRIHAEGHAGVGINWNVIIAPQVVSRCELIDFPAKIDADQAQSLKFRFRLQDQYGNLVNVLKSTHHMEFQLRKSNEDDQSSVKISGLTIAEEGRGIGMASFCLTTVGHFQLSVLLNGAPVASKKFVVLPGRPSAYACHVANLPRRVTSGLPQPQSAFGFGMQLQYQPSPEHSFEINMYDAHQNATNSAPPQVGWSCPSGSPQPQTSVQPISSQSFKITFSIGTPGKYHMHILVDGAHIRGSPFLFNATPLLADFASKRKWIAREILNANGNGHHAPRGPAGGLGRGLSGFGSGCLLNLSGHSRNVVLHESLEGILQMDLQILKGQWRVNFQNAEAVDGGGVFRSWATDLGRYFLDPNFALFMPSKDRPDLSLPNPSSSIHPRHLLWFKAIGRFVGKMASRNADGGDPVFLPGGFTDGFLASILGMEDPVGSSFLDEMKSFDKEMHDQLKSLLDMRDVEDLGLSFDVVVDNFGEKNMIELIPGGKSIDVTDSNKFEYVEKTCQFKLRNQAPSQVGAFRQGFLEAFPESALAALEPADLGLLIFGKSAPLDIQALRSIVRVAAVYAPPPVLDWFWEIMQNDLDEAQQRAMLKFWTGLEREPVSGWRELQPPPGIQFKNGTGAPTAATCSKVLKLPSGLPDKASLKKMIVDFCLPQSDQWGLT